MLLDQLRQALLVALQAPDLAPPLAISPARRATTAARAARSFCRRAVSSARRASFCASSALALERVAAEHGDRVALATQLGDQLGTRALDVVVVGDVARDASPRSAPSRTRRRRSGAPWRYWRRSSRPASASCSASAGARLLLALARSPDSLLDAAPLAAQARRARVAPRSPPSRSRAAGPSLRRAIPLRPRAPSAASRCGRAASRSSVLVGLRRAAAASAIAARARTSAMRAASTPAPSAPCPGAATACCAFATASGVAEVVAADRLQRVVQLVDQRDAGRDVQPDDRLVATCRRGT